MAKYIRMFRRELIPIAVIILLLLSVRSSLADHYIVPTGSMEYTLMLGDRIVVNKAAYGLRLPFANWYLTSRAQPQRGDIVIFDSPEDGKRMVKRLVAIGGDHVVVRRGHLMVNGAPTWGANYPDSEVFGKRRAHLNLSHGGGPPFGPIVIPPGTAMVMGDARGNSRDSRIFGLIPEDAIYARAIGVYWRRGQGPVWKSL
ncbi:signal peptidase I [Candidatus Entotheonella serta]|nr:signal peptidase I [Candidatus Entotheonella serta]